MATEDIRVEDGRLTVERPAKDSTDIDLLDVRTLSFERSSDPTADGALWLKMHDGAEHVIRVSNEDVDNVLPDVYDAWRSSRKEAADSSPDLLSTMETEK